jgi:hypothetical protein
MPRIAVYTAIFTDDEHKLYDTLKENQYLSENCDFYCFTNNRHILFRFMENNFY